MLFVRERGRRSNPRIFGKPAEEYALVAFGLAASGYINDSLVGPLFDRFVPGLKTANNTIGQLTDAFTTALSGWIGSEGARMLGFRGVGEAFLDGGLVLAGGKALASFVPNFGITSRFPSLPGFSALGALWAPRGAPAANGGGAALTAGSALDRYPPFTNNPRPVTADEDVGLV